MADLLFKRGPYSNLHNVAVTDGVVYFTTDTNEIYFDDAAGRHRISDTIVVATYNELNSKYPLAADKAALAGRLVYITDKNILMTYNGTTWMQVNAQKSLQDLTGGNPVFTVTAESAKNINIAQTMGTAGDQVSSSFNIATSTPNMVTLGADGDIVKINVTENRESASIGVEAAVDGAALVVTSIKETLKPDGSVEATAEVKETSATIVGAGNYTDVKVADGNVVVETDLDVALNANAEGQLTLKLYGNDKTTVVKEQNVNFKALLNDGTSANFKQTANDTLTVDLDAYSTAEVDAMVEELHDEIDTVEKQLEAQLKEKINAANAMTFKGTVSNVAGDGATVTGLPTSGVQIGDVYKVAKDGNYALSTTSTDLKYAVVGDLFIATSTTDKEETAGDDQTNVITPANVKWVHVPSGDDAMFTLWAHDGKLTLGAEAEDDGELKGVITEGTAIEIVKTATHKATIAHADVAHTTSNGTNVSESGMEAKTFTAVTGLTVNAQGHVTDIETASFSTLGFVPEASQLLSVSNNTASLLASTVYNDQSEVTNLELKVLSDNLEITKDGDKGIKINHPEYNPATTDAGNKNAIADLKVVTNVEYDALGHLTAVTTGGLNVEALAPTAFSAKAVANDAGNMATITLTEAYGTASQDAMFSLASDTLAITNVGTANEKVSIDLVWGTF